MTTETARHPFRTAVVTFALALATTVSVVGGASADILAPAASTGGAGGGGGSSAGQLDETARSQDLHALSGGDAAAGNYDEVLAGSGYESAEAQANAPTVAEVRSAESAAATSTQEDVLAGSGYEQDDIAVAQHPTQNEQSIQRIESAQSATGALAGGEDDTTAFHPISQNEQSIRLIESTFAPGGMLAGDPAPSARIPVEESEHAQAQNASASTQQPVSRNLSAF